MRHLLGVQTSLFGATLHPPRSRAGSERARFWQREAPPRRTDEPLWAQAAAKLAPSAVLDAKQLFCKELGGYTQGGGHVSDLVRRTDGSLRSLAQKTQQALAE